MKKILLFVLMVLLVNTCCFADEFNKVFSNKRIWIVQVYDTGALGYICPKWAITNDDCSYGKFVYFDFNYHFVDNQRFTIPSNTYLYVTGVYKYNDTDNALHTVRKVDISVKSSKDK